MELIHGPTKDSNAAMNGADTPSIPPLTLQLSVPLSLSLSLLHTLTQRPPSFHSLYHL